MPAVRGSVREPVDQAPAWTPSRRRQDRARAASTARSGTGTSCSCASSTPTAPASPKPSPPNWKDRTSRHWNGCRPTSGRWRWAPLPRPDAGGCLLAKGTAELAGRDPEVTARSLHTLDAVEDALAFDIRAAQRHGDIDPGANPRQLAAVLLAVLRGVEALGKAGKDEASLASIAEAALGALPRPGTTRAPRLRRAGGQPRRALALPAPGANRAARGRVAACAARARNGPPETFSHNQPRTEVFTADRVWPRDSRRAPGCISPPPARWNPAAWPTRSARLLLTESMPCTCLACQTHSAPSGNVAYHSTPPSGLPVRIARVPAGTWYLISWNATSSNARLSSPFHVRSLSKLVVPFDLPELYI